MRKYNKCFPYSGTHRHEDDSIATFFSSVKYYGSNNAVEVIVGTNTLLVGVYTMLSKSGPKIAKVLQDRFYECGIPINIWSNNAQEEFMGSVRKLIRAYGVVSNQYEAHKQKQNPAERRIQEIKGTNCTALNSYGAPR